MKIYTVLSILIVTLSLGCGQSAPPEQAAEVRVTPELLPRSILFGNADKSGLRISPDGTKISYLASVDNVLNIWVGPIDDPAAAQPVTHDTNRGIRRYFWAFDNQHLVYLQDLGGDENWRAYSTDLATGETLDLTPMEGVQVQIQEVSHRFPSEILVGINQRVPQLHDIYRLNITTGAMKQVEQNTGYASFSTDLDYKLRLAMKQTPDGGMQIDRRNGKKWESFSKIPSEDSLTTAPIGFDASGNIAYFFDSRGRDTAALVALDLTSGTETVLYEDPRADLDDAMMHPTEQTIQAAASTFERRQWKILDDSIQGDLDYLATVADGELQVVDRSLDDRRWIVGYELAQEPFAYYLYDRDAQSATYLFSNRAALEEATLANMYSKVIASRDGLDLVSYLTLPVEVDDDGHATRPVPMVLLVHGGPWGRDGWGFNRTHQWLANRGYAVLSVNFRGSTGLGKAFTNAGDLNWGTTMHDDLIDAVDWAVAEGITESAKVAIMGGSYGGYATLAGLTFTPETFACGVDIVGPSNLITLLESIPPYWTPLIEMFAKRVGDPRTDDGRALLTERSPLTHVDKIVRPLLIGQGANDPRVKQAESDQIVEAMNARQIPVTYVLFPDEGHGFARPDNNTAFNAVAEAFLGQCLGGRVEPIGRDFEGSSISVPAGADHIPGLTAALGEPAIDAVASTG